MGEDFGGEEGAVRCNERAIESGHAGIIPDSEVDAAGVVDVAAHDLAGLEGGFAKANLQEFEDVGFADEVIRAEEEAFAEDALEFFDEGVFGVEEGD